MNIRTPALLAGACLIWFHLYGCNSHQPNNRVAPKPDNAKKDSNAPKTSRDKLTLTKPAPELPAPSPADRAGKDKTVDPEPGKKTPQPTETEVVSTKEKPAPAASAPIKPKLENLGVIHKAAWGRGQFLVPGTAEYPPRLLLGFNKPRMSMIVVDLKNGTAREAKHPVLRGDTMGWPYVGTTKEGVVYAASTKGSLIIFDQKTDTVKAVRPIPKARWLRGMAMGADGRIYVSDYPSGSAGVYDPATGKTENFGPQGGPFKITHIYGYSVGCDGEWVYTAAGKVPWYVAAYNLKTKEKKNLLKFSRADHPDVRQVGKDVYLKVNLAKSGKSRARVEYYRLKDGAATRVGRIPRAARQPMPWKGVPQPEIAAATAGRAWNVEGSGPILRYRMPGKPWREVTLPIEGGPYKLMRMAATPKGKLVIYTGVYGDVFRYDPETGSTERLGSPASVGVYALQMVGDQVYFAGYPNAPLGTFQNGKARVIQKYNKLLGAKYAFHMALGADSRIYLGNYAEREFVGGSLGWYDLKTRKPGGIRFSNDECSSLIAARNGELIVYASTAITDPGNPAIKATEGRIIVYSTREQKVVSKFVPAPGYHEAGMIAETEPGMVFGVTQIDRKPKHVMYAADLLSGKILMRRDLPARPTTDLKRGPDGNLYTFLGDELVRINPTTYEITPILKIKPGHMAFIGADLYLAGGDELRRIKDLAR